MIRNKIISDISRMAQDAFKDHEINLLLNNGLYRHWRCANPKRGYYYFDVVAYPGYLIITGDIGDMIFCRTDDMVAWARDSIDSIGYFAQKVVAGDTKEDFDFDVAKEWIEDERVELKAQLADEDYDSKDVEKNLKLLREAEDYLRWGDKEGFIRFIYEDYSDGDSELISTFWNWNGEFLWIREAVMFLLKNLEKVNNE